MCSMVRDDPIHYTYVYQVLIRVLITEIQFSYLEASEKQRDSEKLPRAARPDRRRKHTCSTFGAFQLDGNIGAGRRMAVAKGIGATCFAATANESRLIASNGVLGFKATGAGASPWLTHNCRCRGCEGAPFKHCPLSLSSSSSCSASPSSSVPEFSSLSLSDSPWTLLLDSCARSSQGQGGSCSRALAPRDCLL